jgi:hypothetical protein
MPPRPATPEIYTCMISILLDHTPQAFQTRDPQTHRICIPAACALQAHQAHTPKASISPQVKASTNRPVGPHPLSTCHRKAPNLPKRHTQTGLDAKELTAEQLRLQFYCSKIGDFFFPSLRDLLPGLLFDHPPSLSFFFSFPLYSFYFPISLSLLSFFPGFVSINIVTQLILNYT